MRLHEILTEDYDDEEEHWDKSVLKQIAPDNFTSHVDKLRKDPKHKHLGQGSYSYVHQHDDEPGVVHKVSRKEDPSHEFFKWMSKNESLANNPFFPKIHSTKSAGSHKHMTVEPLVKLKNGPVNDQKFLKALWTELFGPPTKPVTMQKIIDAMGHLVHQNKIGLAQSPRLKQALNAIVTYCDENNVSPDIITDDNYMWRMVGNKPQLVFSDPVA
jgi:hypothetical protein